VLVVCRLARGAGGRRCTTATAKDTQRQLATGGGPADAERATGVATPLPPEAALAAGITGGRWAVPALGPALGAGLHALGPPLTRRHPTAAVVRPLAFPAAPDGAAG